MRSTLLLSRKLLFCAFVFLSSCSFAQVAIGTTGTPPAPKSNAVLLLVGDGKQGLVIPTVSNLNSVVSPDAGMVVFCTCSGGNSVQYFNGSAWSPVGGGSGSQGIQISGNIVSLNNTAGATFALANNFPSSSADGLLLSWNSATNKWETTTNAAPLDGNVLTWNGTTKKWEPKAPITVSLTTLPNGQIFVGNASNVATATTPSTFPLSNFGAAAAAVSLGNNKITNLATPTAPTDGANKAYVDANVLPSLSASQLLSNNGSNVGIIAAGDLSLSVTGTTGTFTIANNAVTNGKLAGSIAASKLIGTDINTVGTITAGTWNGTKLAEAFGGTNQITYATGDILYASAANTLSKLPIGTTNQVLTVNAGIPSWAGFTGWSLGGNTGTIDGAIGTGTNYIGTKDNVPLNFIVNNTKAGRIDPSASANTFFGYATGGAGSSNTAVGFVAMPAGTGTFNTSVGTNSLFGNTTGSINTAVGASALSNTNTGNNNVAVGRNALFSNTAGGGNVSMGVNALFTNTVGNNNVAIGNLADVSSNSLTNAVAIGANASVTTSNTIQLGDALITTVNVGTGTTAKLVAGGLQITGGTLGVGKVLTSDATGNATWQSGGSGWGLTGNAATIDGTNFIGTTDNVPLNFRMNNIKAGRIDNVNASTFFGSVAGNLNTGGQNAGFGSQALEKNIGGGSNAAFGQLSLNNNTTGNYNVAVGAISMTSNTTGGNNIAVGVQANNNNTTGSGNTAIGYNANFGNISSGFNTIVGIDAAFNNTGANNTALGRQALFTNTTGSNNTAVGYKADVAATVTNATAVGANASATTSNTIQLGDALVTTINIGTGTTAKLVAGGLQITGGTLGVGKVLTSDAAGNATWQAGASGWALGGNTGTVDGVVGTGTNYIGTKDNVPLNFVVNNLNAGRIESAAGTANTLLGYQAGSVNTGIQNAAVGYQALQNNTAGQRNAAFGYHALLNNTTGNGNTGVGQNALSLNTTGGANAAFGTAALANNTGSTNTAVGNSALTSNTTASDNAAVGTQSLSFNTIGASNSALGSASLINNTTGSNNTGVGLNALQTNTTGSSNTALGYKADVSSAAFTNATAIGANASVSASNTIQLGDALVTTVNAGTGTTAKLVAGGLQITGGTLGVGKVLTSDATGNAAWTTVPVSISPSNTLIKGNAGGTAQVASQIFDDGTVVNITTLPTTSVAKLTVQNEVSGGPNSIVGGTKAIRAAVADNGSSQVTAIEAQVTGANTGQQTGLFSNVSGTSGFNRAVVAGASNSASTNIGVDAYASTATTGSNYGLQSYIGNATNNYGLKINASGTGTKYGVYSSGEDTNYFSGRVGIGTTTPGVQLEVSADAGIIDILRLTSTNATNPRSFRIGPGTGATTIFGIYDDNAAATRLAIDYASGNVGIGTTSPVNKLDVAGGITVGATYAGVNVAPTNGMVIQGNVSIGSTSNPEKLSVLGGTDNGVFIGGSAFSGATSARLVFQASSGLFIFPGMSPEWTIGSYSSTGGNLDILRRSASNVSPAGEYTFTSTAFNSYNDNNNSLGLSTKRWTTVYAVNGTINTSDKRLKKNIKSLSYGLSEIMKLKPVSYNWKDGIQTTKLGLIAQEIELVIPEVVVKPEAKEGYYGIMYSDLVPVLIKAAQELNSKIEELEKENTQLQSEVASLKEKQLSDMDATKKQLDQIRKVLGMEASNKKK